MHADTGKLATRGKPLASWSHDRAAMAFIVAVADCCNCAIESGRLWPLESWHVPAARHHDAVAGVVAEPVL